MAFGYNHQIRYRGRTYDVQTEDSGRRKGRILSHVFFVGAIVASSRIDYDASIPRSELIELLKRSQKAMIRRLVRGALDDSIAQVVDHAIGPSAPLSIRSGTDGGNDPMIALSVPLLAPSANHRPPTFTDSEPNHPITLTMDNVNNILDQIHNNVSGSLAVALVDYESGMCLGTIGTGLDIDVAAAGNMEVMKAKTRVMRDLGIAGGIEDILITLESQYHIIRPVGDAMFLYLALDRKQGNLALARRKLGSAAAEIKV